MKICNCIPTVRKLLPVHCKLIECLFCHEVDNLYWKRVLPDFDFTELIAAIIARISWVFVAIAASIFVVRAEHATSTVNATWTFRDVPFMASGCCPRRRAALTTSWNGWHPGHVRHGGNDRPELDGAIRHLEISSVSPLWAPRVFSLKVIFAVPVHHHEVVSARRWAGPTIKDPTLVALERLIGVHGERQRTTLI